MKDRTDATNLQRYVLGTAGLGGVWGPVDPEASVNSILYALEKGIRAIDTAPAYGDGESFVGRALQQWKGARPLVSTKVGRLKSYASDQGIYDYTPDGMARSVDRSLHILGVSNADILFLHEPAAIPGTEIEPAVLKMMALKQQGYTTQIGLGGNYPAAFLPYLDAGVFDVVMEYNRLDACCIDALDTSLAWCCSRNITYWAASPLHMGLLGRCFESFARNRPQWLEHRFLDTASGVNKMAIEKQLSLSTLALRFLQNIPWPFRVVIGPAGLQELNESLAAISEGPLDHNLYNKIIGYIKEPH
ncbi:aldo/keto reductase [Niabella sp. CC-SYL272]|uniref:aldo/keto reductase n=1 Tax=Niabella agricola TaxID=2891571 RepID=UPI001F3727AD|nr:aldo/keto reductase [Niabella agricola]MCF3108214.1 aldo/keto reductase [Niabella agricola]